MRLENAYDPTGQSQARKPRNGGEVDCTTHTKHRTCQALEVKQVTNKRNLACKVHSEASFSVAQAFGHAHLQVSLVHTQPTPFPPTQHTDPMIALPFGVFLLSTLLFPLVLPTPAAADLALLPNRDAARSMSWAQLEQIFKEGTIDEGIPEGFAYGYGLINPTYHGVIQWAADKFWNGKRFEVQSGENCHGRDCGQKATVFNYITATDHVNWQEIPGVAFIGRLKDADPSLASLQVDNKPSVLIDYHRIGATYDEIRLVNSKERIYLGRGIDWLIPDTLAYFVLQFYDAPQQKEIASGTHCYYQARESAYMAAGATEIPDPTQILQAMPGGGWKWKGLKGKEGEKGLMVGLHGGEEMNCPQMLERLGEHIRGGKMGGN